MRSPLRFSLRTLVVLVAIVAAATVYCIRPRQLADGFIRCIGRGDLVAAERFVASERDRDFLRALHSIDPQGLKASKRETTEGEPVVLVEWVMQNTELCSLDSVYFSHTHWGVTEPKTRGIASSGVISLLKQARYR